MPTKARSQQSRPAGVTTLKGDTDIRAGVAALRRRCQVMRRVHDLVGDPQFRRRPSGFVGLSQVVVNQQLSAASGGAIWRRLALAVDPFDAETLLGRDIAVLKGAGLSQAKIRTLRAVAEAILSGRLALDRRQGDDALREALLAICGIGPWTADIYLMFCLGRADSFAPGDLALQLAAQRAFALEVRPGARELAEMAERWRPWRAVAAHLLWAFHAHRETGA